MSARSLHRIASAGLIALIVLCLAWEIWLAPLRAGGSWLAIKVIPLLIALPGILRGQLYTHRAMTLLINAYFIEGVVRAWSDRGWSAQLASIEIILALVIFTSAIAYIRTSAGHPKKCQ